MNTIKNMLSVTVPAWLFVLVIGLMIVTTSIDTGTEPAVDPVKVTTITLTGEGGESLFSFRIQESESEDQEADQD
jgi:hypothetical protein